MASVLPFVASLLGSPAHAEAATDRCQSSVGAPDAAGVRPVQITCRWPDVSAAALEAMFDQYDGYHRFVWALADSEVRQADGHRALVWQRQEVPGAAPRESLVWLEGQPNDSGSRTYTWTTAASEPLDLSAHAVRALRNDGRWEIVARDKGVDVVFEICYSPGGWVPDWLVRWCQTLGAEKMMDEIRQFALQIDG